LGGAGKLKILLQDGIEVERPVSSAPQGIAPGIEIAAFDIAGRRDDAYCVSDPESGRLDARRYRGRHTGPKQTSGNPIRNTIKKLKDESRTNVTERSISPR
jgi:hypothetical protein